MKARPMGLVLASLLFLGLAIGSSPIVVSEAHATETGMGFASPILNLQDLIHELGLRAFYSRPASEAHPLKIAILDNGFTGYEKQIGVTLPANTQYHPGPIQPPSTPERHGLVMAQLFYSLLTDAGRAPQFAPAEFHLYNTYGYSNLKAAIQDVIHRNVDIVLYSQIWEYGGNWDGKGFINQLVSQATNAGILWVNASGDFGNTTFNSPIVDGPDDWVKLPDPNSSVEIRCNANAHGNCPLRLVLSWNDFKDDVHLGTSKDLDLVLTDDTLNIIQTSTLVQTTGPADQPGYSKYPREILTASLKPGLYFIRVKNRSRNFTSKDRMRITASGDFITMPDHDPDESLLNPADNPQVISVGASDTEKSSHSLKLRKPEISTPSLIKLAENAEFKGTSTSAAMAAAWIAIQKTLHPEWERKQFLDAFLAGPDAPGHGSDPDTSPGHGLPLSVLGFGPTGPGCFIPVDTANQPPLALYIQHALSLGGTLVETSMGWKIFYPFDPIRLLPNLHRIRFDDILVIGPGTPFSPQGTSGLYPRTDLSHLNLTLIEVLQTPDGQRVCQTP